MQFSLLVKRTFQVNDKVMVSNKTININTKDLSEAIDQTINSQMNIPNMTLTSGIIKCGLLELIVI